MNLEYVKLGDAPPFVNLSSKNRLTDIQMIKAYNKLCELYNLVVKQQCIIYKEVGKKESFCIPDFICSVLDYVIVIDAKIIPATEKKMDEYSELMRYLLAEANDKRVVHTNHLYLILIDHL